MSISALQNAVEDKPRRRGFRCLDLAKQLAEDPDEVVIIHAPEDLGNEGAALHEEFDRKFETHEHELGLAVRILDPCRADVRRTVVQHYIRFPILELATNEIATLRGGNISGKGSNTGYWTDGYKIDALKSPHS